MTRLDIPRVKEALGSFDFKSLFIEELGWENPSYTHPYPVVTDEVTAQGTLIAELGGVVVMEIIHDPLPNAKQREKIHRSMRSSFAERVLIFVDRERTRSCWSWVKVDEKKEHLRDLIYVRGVPAEGFIGRIASLSVDLAEYDPDGRFGLQAASNKVKAALDVQRVVKRFYTSYKDIKDEFVLAIGGIDDPADRAWYSSVVLNRLMFVYFLQKGLFLDGGDERYLEKKLALHREGFYGTFLQALFFEAFAKPNPSPEARTMCGDIPYLNGGLFRPHKLEEKYKDRITISSEAFDPILTLFGGYSWTFNDVPEDPDKTLNPDVLGYIFEKYINQKEFGAYYTPHEITDYLCHQTIHRLILDKMADQGFKGHDSVGDMLLNLKGDGVLFLLKDVLPTISLLDPACGSGAFLYAALQTLLVIYTSAMGRITDLKHEGLDLWRARTFAGHRSELYWLKKRIITDNLYGVDIMEEAVEIAKLRLFMALVQSARPGETLEALPNIDFNVLPGNSLIGLMRVEDEAFDKQRDATASLFGSSLDYAELVHRRNIATGEFRNPKAGSDVAQLGRDVDKLDAEALPKLNAMLLEAFRAQKVGYEEATWDTKAGKEGKPNKRPVEIEDIEDLQPFHWGYSFNERFANRRGFDAIITNPPWDVLKPQTKEFFAKHSDLVQKNAMTLEGFDEERTRLMQDPEVRNAWLEYQSKFPAQADYLRTAPEYAYQVTVIDGRKKPNDLNLYKLFAERCFNLLRSGGLMGIVIPSGFYTDLGTKSLRRLFFEKAEITGLFGFENRKESVRRGGKRNKIDKKGSNVIFEGVDSRYKFIVLSARKGGTTTRFPAAFMRHNPVELSDFPRSVGFTLSVDAIKKLAPDSWSLFEFQSGVDASVAEKLSCFSTLGSSEWSLRLGRELHSGDDRALLLSTPRPTTWPTYRGGNIWHFDAAFAPIRSWVDEESGRRAISPAIDGAQTVDRYRIAFRDIASNTNERTMSAAILPPKVFTVDTLKITRSELDAASLLYLTALLNSFVVDSFLRLKVTNHCSAHFVYGVPVPHPSTAKAIFATLVVRASRLTATDAAFADLWNAVMADDRTYAAAEATVRPGEPPISRAWTPTCGATGTALRARLRAEIDGLVAHLYGLTEEEFAHILGTFPLVPEGVKAAARTAYRDVALGVVP